MNWFRCWVVLFLLTSRMAISQENDSIQVNAAKLAGVASAGGIAIQWCNVGFKHGLVQRPKSSWVSLQ
jgi:hypothetical protein